MNLSSIYRKASCFVPVIIFSAGAGAAGFQLQNQNAAGTSVAYAGAAAIAEDASTIFFNPAGMLDLEEGSHIALPATLIDRSVKFKNNGTVAITGTSAFALGDEGGDGANSSVIPAFYLSTSAGENMSWGIGVSPTYGSETKFSDTFIGRFSATGSKIEQKNFNPSFAYRLSDSVRFGVGLNYAQNDTQVTKFIASNRGAGGSATVTSGAFVTGLPYTIIGVDNGAGGAVTDFTAVGSANNTAGTIFVATGAGTGTGTASKAHFDAALATKLNVDGNATGYNLGMMIDASDSTRFGISYRSKLEFDTKGKIAVGTSTGDVTAKFSTPANWSLAMEHTLENGQTKILADYSQTEWSVWDTLVLKCASVTVGVGCTAIGNTQTSLEYGFKNVSRIGLGVLHQTSQKWQLRGGYAKDNSPVPSDALRTMTIPDSDRTWLSGGARYQMDETTSIDLGYAHIMFADAKTAKKVSTSTGVVIQTIQGSFDNEVNLFSVQFNKSF